METTTRTQRAQNPIAVAASRELAMMYAKSENPRLMTAALKAVPTIDVINTVVTNTKAPREVLDAAFLIVSNRQVETFGRQIDPLRIKGNLMYKISTHANTSVGTRDKALGYALNASSEMKRRARESESPAPVHKPNLLHAMFGSMMRGTASREQHAGTEVAHVFGGD